MLHQSTAEKEEFRFTWRIENFSLCHKAQGNALTSPSFTMGTVDKTDWHLNLYPRGHTDHNLSCDLVREDDKGPATIKVHSQFSLVIASGVRRCEFKSESKQFSKKTSFNRTLISRTKLFKRKHSFLPSDVLTVQCDLWRDEDGPSTVNTTPEVKSLVACLYNIPSDARGFVVPEEIYAATSNEVTRIKKKMYPFMNECKACTRIGVEHRSLTWPVRQFSSLKPTDKVALPLACSSKRVPQFTLLIYQNPSKKIQIDIRKMIGIESGILFVVCRISVLDVDGRVYLDREEEHSFASPKAEEVWNFPGFFTKPDLVQNRKLCLPGDELRLRFEFTFSTGIELSQMEEFSFVSLAYETSTEDESVGTMVEDLKAFYAEERAHDFSLKIKDLVFPAHRAVLCFRSPVFCAMLDHDTTEKKTGAVDITDMEPRTLSRMLEFMYTDSVDIVHSDSAMKLYTAADKYQIRALRNLCSVFLQDNLSKENVFDVLVLADIHQDKDLLESTYEFLFQPPYENVLSDQFEAFIASNTQRAQEVLKIWIRTIKSQMAIGF